MNKNPILLDFNVELVSQCFLGNAVEKIFCSDEVDFRLYRFASFFRAFEVSLWIKLSWFRFLVVPVRSSDHAPLAYFEPLSFKLVFFPANHFHNVDTAWVYQYLPSISFTYYHAKVAQFWIHNSEGKRIVHKHQVYAMMSSMVEYLPTDQKAQVLSLVDASKNLIY